VSEEEEEEKPLFVDASLVDASTLNTKASSFPVVINQSEWVRINQS
jgi:hypothetical protein